MRKLRWGLLTGVWSNAKEIRSQGQGMNEDNFERAWFSLSNRINFKDYRGWKIQSKDQSTFVVLIDEGTQLVIFFPAYYI